jgi:hypothetical protein
VQEGCGGRKEGRKEGVGGLKGSSEYKEVGRGGVRCIYTYIYIYIYIYIYL